MIDFDRFWAVPDEDDDEGFAGEIRPGVTPAKIAAWEAEHGVTLPEPLRSALQIQNGGAVRDSEVEIDSLDWFKPVDAGFWEWTEITAEDAPNRNLVIQFGDSGYGGTILLNFNANGPHGEPSVWTDQHGESAWQDAPTLTGFFTTIQAADDEPGIDWAAIAAHTQIIARQTDPADPDADEEDAVSLDQILIRDGDALIFCTNQQGPDGQEMTRTRLPLPLDVTQTTIRPVSPDPGALFLLSLQPEDHDAIVHEEAATTSDGRWKNSTMTGAPIYVVFEATDRTMLEAIRTTVLGGAGAAQAQARQDEEAALQDKLDELTPEQRSFALMQTLLKDKTEHAAELGDAGQIAPELAELAEVLRRRTAAIAARVEQAHNANSIDPAQLRAIEEHLRNLKREQ